MYHIDVQHDGLRKFRRLSGADEYVLERRARVQAEAWEERWRRRLALDRQGDDTLRHLPNFEAQMAHAAKLTDEAQHAVAAWGTILAGGFEAAPFKMEMLYNSKVFPERRPAAPVDQEAPEEPNRDDPSFKHVEEFDVVGEFWSLLLPGVKRKRASAAQSKRDAAQQRYDSAYRSWQDAKLEIARQNARARAMFDIALDEWWVKAQAFQKQQQEENAQIEKFRLRYGRKEPDAVIEFLDAVLSHAEYPDAFPMHWEMDFQPETGILIVDYELPPPDDFPRLKAVKYDVVRDTFVQNYWSAPEIAQLYEGAAFQTCLRTLHGLFAADKENVLASVTFNGWANFTDRVHGRPARVCVMSVQASKAEIARADLRKVDPKIAFKSLKGIAGTRLADMTAVVPVLSMKGSDARPVAANDVMAREARPPNSQDRA